MEAHTKKVLSQCPGNITDLPFITPSIAFLATWSAVQTNDRAILLDFSILSRMIGLVGTPAGQTAATLMLKGFNSARIDFVKNKIYALLAE